MIQTKFRFPLAVEKSISVSAKKLCGQLMTWNNLQNVFENETFISNLIQCYQSHSLAEDSPRESRGHLAAHTHPARSERLSEHVVSCFWRSGLAGLLVWTERLWWYFHLNCWTYRALPQTQRSFSLAWALQLLPSRIRCMSTPFTDCIPCTLLFSIGSNTWQFNVFDGSRQTASLKSDLDNVVAMFFCCCCF